MKIKKNDNYKVELWRENNQKTDHNKVDEGYFRFTGKDLMYAIISSGMPDVYLEKKAKNNRKEEILFKIKLIETFIKESKDGSGILLLDMDRRKYLDSSEKGAINYWIGMIFITLLGQKKYKYDYMVHLSMIKEFDDKAVVEKISFKSGKKNTYKSPDLIAIKSVKNNSTSYEFGVFEAKGYSNYDKEAIERGWDQAHSIRTINKIKPGNQLVVMTITEQRNGIKMIEKDPDEGDKEIEIDMNLLCAYHFIPVFELMEDLKIEETVEWRKCLIETSEENFTIKIKNGLYNKISKVYKEIYIGENEMDVSKIHTFGEIARSFKNKENFMIE